ncbi:hypothetical protein ACQ4PT_034441 [Festuca glaucescens]
MVPMNLLQWLAGHTSHGEAKFLQHKEKIIHFTKDMVDKVFGFPSGSKPFVMESTDPEIIREVEGIHDQYLLGKKQITVSNVESVLLGANEEVIFIRSFLLLFITTVLCPSTYNFVNPKYLYSLRDNAIVEVVNLDFGTLCLNHLWNEVDAWKAKVVYMDFLDFGANVGQIDYSLPRMSHIRNDDFTLVHNLDRNLLSRKSYGFLPLRDISLTPYSVDLAIVPAVLEPNGGNDVVDIPALAHVPPNEAIVHTVIEDDFMEDIGNHQEIIDISDSQVDFDSLGSYTMEPEGMSRSPHASDDFVESRPAYAGTPGMETMEGGSKFGDALRNIAISYAELSDSYSAEEIVEGFVTKNMSETYVVSNQENRMSYNGHGIPIDMHHDGSPVTNTAGTDAGTTNNAVIVMPGSISDKNSFEKRNRRKRAEKATTPERIMPELLIDGFIEDFHNQHLRKNRFKQSNK